MKFTMIVAILATAIMAQASWASQADDSSNGVVILNTNSNTNSASQAQSSDQKADVRADQGQKAIQQPTTVVEASPATESRAEVLRRERQGAEIQTEQKIVEKLEDSRLQEEKARAERLFGGRLDPQIQQQTTTTTTVVTPAPAEKVQVQEPVKATQVTIEKVEIIQPKEEKVVEVKKEEKKEEIVEVKEETKMKAPMAEEVSDRPQYTVGGAAGNLQYNASNVKSNYGVGFTIGTILQNRIGIELGYLYSNHFIDTFWQAPLYREMDQSDISIAGKYYILDGKLKPYGGVALDYISRTYNQRVRTGQAWNYNSSADSETTNAVNMGVLLGVDFELSKNFLLGVGYEYSFNLMNTNEPDWVNSYQLPAGTTELEKISFSQITVNAKFLF